jgi:hypothetical protein
VVIVAVMVIVMPISLVTTAMFFLPLMTSEVLYGSVVPFPLGMFVAIGHVATVPIPHIVVTIYMPAKMLPAMEPWSRSYEDAVREPFRPIVAIGSARIRRVVIVPVRASRFRSNLNTEADL